MIPSPLPQTDKHYLHNYTPGAMLPLTQALISGALVFVGVLVINWIVLDLLDPYKPALVLAVITTIATWTTRMRLWNQLANLERMTGLDINKDGRIGDAEEVQDINPEIHRIRIQLTRIGEDQHLQISNFDLPKGITNEHLETLAYDIFVARKPFTETECSGPGKMSMPKFRMLRAVMEQQELCERGTSNKIILNQAGEKWLRNYLNTSPPPPMDDEQNARNQE